MTCFVRLRVRLALAALALSAQLLVPVTALAGPLMCDLEPDGRLVCFPPATCTSRRDCVGLPSTEDWFCRVVGTETSTPICVPSCGTIFACDPEMPPTDQCPVLPGRMGACSPLDPAADLGPDPLPLGLCTYTSVTRPASIDYCGEPTAHILGATFRSCHTLPRAAGDRPVFTVDYSRGDCDEDGCPNGRDALPCMEGGMCLDSAAASPTCAPAPPLACMPAATGLACGDARPCQFDGIPCATGRCEDGWSEGGPRCRPECSTLFLCSTAAASSVGPGAEAACPRLGTEVGMCLLDPTMSPLVDDDRYDGICVYPSWRSDGSCDLSAVHTSCAVDAEGVPTANFYQGDCDTDGIPNGCDSLVCDPAMGPGPCRTPPGDPSCRPMLPPPDAGTSRDDAAAANDDAAVDDSPDAAVVALDAGPAVTFGGGGGCRCRAPGAPSEQAPWSSLAVLAGVLAASARRRRPAVRG